MVQVANRIEFDASKVHFLQIWRQQMETCTIVQQMGDVGRALIPV